MQVIAIVIVALACITFEVIILGAGVWITFILGHSYWWWVVVVFMSCGICPFAYNMANAINGHPIVEEKKDDE